MADETVRLNEHDKDEWFDIAHCLKPGLTRYEYEAMWGRFQRAKAEYLKSSALH